MIVIVLEKSSTRKVLRKLVYDNMFSEKSNSYYNQEYIHIAGWDYLFLMKDILVICVYLLLHCICITLRVNKLTFNKKKSSIFDLVGFNQICIENW